MIVLRHSSAANFKMSLSKGCPWPLGTWPMECSLAIVPMQGRPRVELLWLTIDPTTGVLQL